MSRRDVSFFAIGVLIGAGVTWGITGAPSSYEECMLDEMRSIPQQLAGLANDVCRERFPGPARLDATGLTPLP